jgi:hypothetical protein
MNSTIAKLHATIELLKGLDSITIDDREKLDKLATSLLTKAVKAIRSDDSTSDEQSSKKN